MIHKCPCGACIRRHPGCVVEDHRDHALRGGREAPDTDKTGPVSWQIMRQTVRTPFVHTQVATFDKRGNRVTLLEFARGEQAIADMDAMAKGGPDFDVREWRARANTVGSRAMLDSSGIHRYMGGADKAYPWRALALFGVGGGILCASGRVPVLAVVVILGASGRCTAGAVTVAEMLLGVVGLKEAEVTVGRGVRVCNLVDTVAVRALAEAMRPIAERWKRDGTTS